jgi:hypothetical protein
MTSKTVIAYRLAVSHAASPSVPAPAPVPRQPPPANAIHSIYEISGDGELYLLFDPRYIPPCLTMPALCAAVAADQGAFMGLSLSVEKPTLGDAPDMYVGRVRLTEKSKHVFVAREDGAGRLKLTRDIWSDAALLTAIMTVASPPHMPLRLLSAIKSGNTATIHETLLGDEEHVDIPAGTRFYHTGAYVSIGDVVSHSPLAGRDFTSAEVCRAFALLYPVFASATLSSQAPTRAYSRDGMALGTYVTTRQASMNGHNIVCARGAEPNDLFRAHLHEIVERLSQAIDADRKLVLFIWGQERLDMTDLDIVVIHPEKCDTICGSHLDMFTSKDNKPPLFALTTNTTQIPEAT